MIAGITTRTVANSQAAAATTSAISPFHQRRRGVWRNWLWRLGSIGRAEGLVGIGGYATGAPCCQPPAAGYGASPCWYGYCCPGGWYGYGCVEGWYGIGPGWYGACGGAARYGGCAAGGWYGGWATGGWYGNGAGAGVGPEGSQRGVPGWGVGFGSVMPVPGTRCRSRERPTRESRSRGRGSRGWRSPSRHGSTRAWLRCRR